MMGRLLLALLFLSGGVTACSNGDMPPPLGDTDAKVIVVTGDAASDGPCDPPKEGCPCSAPGDQLYCGVVYRVSGNHVDCAKGYQTCRPDGGWGPCEGPAVFTGD